MKCEESQTLLEEYLDGELATPGAEQVSTHLEICPPCRKELQQLRFEARAYQKYEREVNLSPELWAGVRARIAEPLPLHSPSIGERWQIAVGNFVSLRFNLAFSAVLVLAAVFGTVAVMKYLENNRPASSMALTTTTPAEVKPSTDAAPLANDPNRVAKSAVTARLTDSKKRNPAGSRRATTSLNGQSSPVPAQLVRDAERNYLSAIAILTRDGAQRPSPMDPETRAKLDGALASIDRTISATRKAVQKNPNDPVAVQYMLTAYAKKVDVLKEMTSY